LEMSKGSDLIIQSDALDHHEIKVFKINVTIFLFINLFNHLGRDTTGDDLIRDIFIDKSKGSHNGILADRDSWHEQTMITDLTILFYY